MTDYSSANISITGTISNANTLVGLIRAAHQDRVIGPGGSRYEALVNIGQALHRIGRALLLTCERGEALHFEDESCLNGKFESLEQFCRENGLAYVRHNGAGERFHAGVTSWKPGMAAPASAFTVNGETVIALSLLEMALPMEPTQAQVYLRDLLKQAQAAEGADYATALVLNGDFSAEVNGLLEQV